MDSLKGWVFIVNPASGAGSTGKQWARIQDSFKKVAEEYGKKDIEDVQVKYTSAMGEGTTICREALQDGARVIVAVGGDGTLSEVVQGFFKPQADELINPNAEIGYIPKGTGGDFVKTLSWTTKNEDSLRRLFSSNRMKIDVGQMNFQSNEGQEVYRHFINISSTGSSAKIADIANNSPKFLGSLTFLQASVQGILTDNSRDLKIKVDEGEWREVAKVSSLAVCNGQYFGGGMKVCPSAVLNDGKFHCTMWKDFTIPDWIMNLNGVYSGDHVNFHKTESFVCNKIQVEAVSSTRDCLIEIDGETPGKLPATFRILPSMLNLIC